MPMATHNYMTPLLRRNVFAVGLLFAALGTTHAQNILTNGGFEAPIINPTNTYEYRIGVQLDGWIVSTGNRGVLHFGSGYHPTSAGSQSIQLETSGDSISQSFPTPIGGSYVLEFDLAAYDTSGAQITVTVGDVSTNCVASSDGTFVRFFVPFAAVSSKTTLTCRKTGRSPIKSILTSTTW